MPLLRDVVLALGRIAPLAAAEPWDNVGLVVGDPAQSIEGALLAIDCTRAVLDEAIRERCELVVAYHPPIFDGLKRFVAGHVAFEAARHGVAIYSPHTALDVAEGGTNDVLADALGMTERAPLRISKGATDGTNIGIGRVGAVSAKTGGELVERLKRVLGLEHVLAAGPLDQPVARVAVCAGAGRELLRDVLALRDVDLFVTGELPHHDALRAVASATTVVALRHSASERCTLPHLAARLRRELPDLRTAIAKTDHEPYVFA